MRCQPRRRAHRRSRFVRPNFQRCFAALLLLSAVLLSQLPTTVARASQPGASEPEMVAGAAVEHDHGNAEGGDDVEVKHANPVPVLAALANGIDGIREVLQDVAGTLTYFTSLARNFTSGGEWKEWYETATAEL